MRDLLLFWFISLTIIVSSKASAQKQSSILPTIREHQIYSTALDEKRTIDVYLPASYEPKSEPYVVLYLLDGRSHLLHVGSIVEYQGTTGALPKMLVVGIRNTNRSRDLSTKVTVKNPQSHAWLPENTAVGGAERFRTFLINELKPFIDKNYATKGFDILGGHSLAGLFVMDTLLHQPNSFDAYLALSPNFIWNEWSILSEARTFFQKQSELQTFLHMSTGSNDYPIFTAAQRRMEGVLYEVAPKHMHWNAELIPKASHQSSVPQGFINGLMFVFEGWNITQEPLYLATGANHLRITQNHYAELRKRLGQTFRIPVGVYIEMIGYYFWQGRRKPAKSALRHAISTHPNAKKDLVNQFVFELALKANDLKAALRWARKNSLEFPNTGNVWDSLADIYERMGNLDEARKSYAKAVEIGEKTSDPQTELYRSNLLRMQKKTSAQN